MAILEKDIAFGIVLYNETLQSCITYQSLIKSILKYNKKEENITIIIYDNTPKSGSEVIKSEILTEDGIDVHYLTTYKNEGLPYAYNEFSKLAQKLKKDWIVLLDQDTELPLDFFSNYLQINPALKIHCPLVFSNGNLMSPAHYRYFRSYPMEIPVGNETLLDRVSCINSGLMINTEFFEKIGGYNSYLFLDFCDHDFIHKIKQNKINKIGIIPCHLVQDFSSINHTREQALTRYKIFIKDLKVFYKGKDYLSIFFSVDLPRLLKLCYQYRSLQFLKIRFT